MPEFLTEYLDGLTEGLLITLRQPDAYLNKIALTATIMVVGLLLNILFKRLIIKSINEYKREITARRVARNIITTFTILAVLFIWIQAINALILMVLLFGVFIVFMVRGLTTNIIGYFVIKYRKYFEIGHRIEINNIVGDVIDINPIHIKLLEVRHNLSSDSNTGRIVKLPNSIVFNESIEMVGVDNVFVWHEIKYVLAFDSDWKDAERIITRAGDVYFSNVILPLTIEGHKHLPNNQSKLKPVFALDTNTEGIVLILRYMVDYRQGTSTKTDLQRVILAEFEKNPEIKFASVDIRIFPE
ncbi:mechanosensitive ion channel family protein [Sporosarcina ureae]|uniref:mechanosensitive ion channel family protein n=1 Tax=Sporosarcina ureae TaxID=1571 RepID=UPI0026EE0642|nr:mechanosensitive ion channel family protein [Sporosarcina ureae]